MGSPGRGHARLSRIAAPALVLVGEEIWLPPVLVTAALTGHVLVWRRLSDGAAVAVDREQGRCRRWMA